MTAEKRKLCLLILTFILLSLNIVSLSYASSEKIVYMFGLEEEDNTITGVKSIFDKNGNLHIFAHVKNNLGNRLLHIYFNGSQQLQVVEENVPEVTLYNVYTFGDGVKIIYSTTTSLGEKIIKTFAWTPQRSYYTTVLTLSATIQYYISFLKCYIFKGLTHIFYAYYYGDNMENMNVTHIWGLNSFEKEEFSINSDIHMKNPYRRQILDIILDYNNTIWYIYRPYGKDTSIGIGKLENSGLNETKEYDFTGLQKTIENVIVVPEEDNDNVIFKGIFIDARKIYTLIFNGSLYLNVDETYYTNPIDFKYNYMGGKDRIIIADEIEGYINFYYGEREDKIWNFVPIVTQNPIIANGTYNLTLLGDKWLLSYVAVVNPSNYNNGFVRYKEHVAIGLFVVSNSPIVFELLIENLTPYSLMAVFFQEHWIELVIGAIISLTTLITLVVLFKKKKEALFSFLFSKEIGEHSKFVLIWLNIFRFIRNTLGVIKLLWFSNKRRTFLNMLGFLITGFLISSAVIISQSEETAMIKAFYKAKALEANSQPTLYLETSLYWEDGNATVPTNYNELVINGINDIFANKAIFSYFHHIEASYYTSVTVRMGDISLLSYQLATFSNNSDRFFESLLSDGRIPLNDKEVVISGQVARRFNININDTINIVFKKNSENYMGYNYTMKVVGTFEPLNLAQMKRLATFLDYPFDICKILETASILTKTTILFNVLQEVQKVDLKLRAIFQVSFDFEDFKIKDREEIVSEVKNMEGKQYSFAFDESAAIRLTDEISTFFEAFNTYYLNNMARLYVFSIPAILLAIFMVFEASEMFSSSYLQEINILRNRGLKDRRIFSIYLSTRMAELIIASFASYGIAILAAYPLVRINGFISFGNTDAKVRFSQPLLEITLVFLALLILSLPRMLVILRRRKRIIKPPNKLVKLLRAFSWREFFFLLLGFVLFFYFYEQTFVAYSKAAAINFQLYLTLTIIGAIFTLLGGLPIIIKLFSVLWRIIGFISWRTRKSKSSFLLTEISKDIKYFENLTVIFLMIIAIIIPVLVVPYSKETTLNEQAYFINGTDIRIRNWGETNVSISEIMKIPGVKAVTEVEEWTLYLGTFEGMRIIAVNTSEFTKVFYKPSSKVASIDWDKIEKLTDNTAIISQTIENDFFTRIGDSMTFANPDVKEWRHTVTVIGKFDLFPTFFFEDDVNNDAYLMIISLECFEILKGVITRRLLTDDSLYIRTKSRALIPSVEKALFKLNPKFLVETHTQIKNSLKTPLYNVFIIEMLLSLIVGVAALVFTSFTTAIKVLEKRVIKHDILKKMGVKVPLIINLTAIQILLASFLPALIIGLPSGFSVIKPVIEQLEYGSSPYPMTIYYPILGIIIVLIGTPILIYLGLQYILRKEFANYVPTQIG